MACFWVPLNWEDYGPRINKMKRELCSLPQYLEDRGKAAVCNSQGLLPNSFPRPAPPFSHTGTALEPDCQPLSPSSPPHTHTSTMSNASPSSWFPIFPHHTPPPASLPPPSPYYIYQLSSSAYFVFLFHLKPRICSPFRPISLRFRLSLPILPCLHPPPSLEEPGWQNLVSTGREKTQHEKWLGGVGERGMQGARGRKHPHAEECCLGHIEWMGTWMPSLLSFIYSMNSYRGPTPTQRVTGTGEQTMTGEERWKSYVIRYTHQTTPFPERGVTVYTPNPLGCELFCFKQKSQCSEPPSPFVI